MSLIVHQIAVGGLDDNFAYVVGDTATKQAMVVDPSGNLDAILRVTDEEQYDLIGVLITHTHHDHIERLDELLRSYLVPVYVHEKGVGEIISEGKVVTLTDGDKIQLGESHLEVMYTPGHIDDAVCYYIPASDSAGRIPQVIVGDTLFVGGCGRTTPTRVKDLYESLAELAALPDDTVIYPGHDYGETPTSTIGHEKQTNKYYLAKNFNEFHQLRLG